MAAPTSRRAVPSAFITHTCVSSIVVSEEVSARFVANIAIDRPSGDQTGLYSAFLVFDNCFTLRLAMFSVNTS